MTLVIKFFRPKKNRLKSFTIIASSKHKPVVEILGSFCPKEENAMVYIKDVTKIIVLCSNGAKFSVKAYIYIKKYFQFYMLELSPEVKLFAEKFINRKKFYIK